MVEHVGEIGHPVTQETERESGSPTWLPGPQHLGHPLLLSWVH